MWLGSPHPEARGPGELTVVSASRRVTDVPAQQAGKVAWPLSKALLPSFLSQAMKTLLILPEPAGMKSPQPF